MSDNRVERISFILLSHLCPHGGGRETWIKNFIPALCNDVGKDRIILYCLGPHGDAPTLAHSLREFCVVREIIKPYFVPRFLWRSFFKFYLAGRSIQKLLKPSDDKGGLVVFVGSLWEPLFINVGRNTKTAIWLRSILKSEINGSWLRFFGSVVSWNETRILRKADLVFSNGSDTRAAYLSFGIDSEVINNSIRLEDFHRIPLLGSSIESPVVVAYIGRLVKVKGIRDFLESIYIFNREYPGLVSKVKFQVVGDGSFRQDVIDNIESNVEYLGPIPNESMPSYLATISAAVCLTYSGISSNIGGGGVSNGLVEIIAAGRVPICWDTMTFRQVVDETSAFLVKEGDVRGLAQVYKQIVQERSRLAPISEKARIVSEKFSVEKSAKDFLRIVGSV